MQRLRGPHTAGRPALFRRRRLRDGRPRPRQRLRRRSGAGGSRRDRPARPLPHPAAADDVRIQLYPRNHLAARGPRADVRRTVAAPWKRSCTASISWRRTMRRSTAPCCGPAAKWRGFRSPTSALNARMRIGPRRLGPVYPTKLPDVCRRLGIALRHHDALSDAEACARIVLAACECSGVIRGRSPGNGIVRTRPPSV